MGGGHLIKVVQQPWRLRREWPNAPKSVPDGQRAAHQLVPCTYPRCCILVTDAMCVYVGSVTGHVCKVDEMQKNIQHSTHFAFKVSEAPATHERQLPNERQFNLR